ncbi:MAG: hypothetical protein HQK76_14240 [Desulfobacterales bacterium]|nr:hypothetical protein [Desulfobacterales bacterium]
METILCKRCICSSVTPYVEIRQDGICSKCIEYDDYPKYNLEAFTKRMEEGFDSIRSQKIPYHAMVMFSGGKDSSYILNMAKNKYKLRTLAFAVIHPFVNDLSIRNMDTVASKLDVDLIKYKINENVVKKLMRYAVLEGHRYGLGELFGCAICSHIYHMISLAFAIKMKIPYKLDGTDPTQSAISLPIYIEGHRLKSFHLGGRGLGSIEKMCSDALGNEYEGTIYDFNLHQFHDQEFPSKVSPFSFCGYDHEKNVKELVDNGILTIDESNPEKTNCDLLHFFSYVSFKRYDSHPYVKHFSQGLRKDVATLVDQFFTDGHERCSREEHIKILDEYKNILFYVGEHPELTTDDAQKLHEKVPTILSHMGAEHLTSFLIRVMKIHDYAKYFDINLI